MKRSAGLAVEATGLMKTFGTTQAVDGVDLAVPAGTVYGFLGPNGAGKTTTLRMLATLVRPDAGTATVFGYDVVRDAAAVRDRISLTGQYTSLDEGLTGRENLVLLGRLHGHAGAAAASRADELLGAFSLLDAADRLVSTYSGGMRRRLDISAGLIVTPDLLFLDEPTTGLDPRSRHDVWAMVRAFVAEGTTVLLTTQYLDEADQLADRIAVLDQGRLVAEGTSDELKASVGGGTVRVRLAEPHDRAVVQRVLTRATGGTVTLDADPVALTAQLPIAGPDGVESAVEALATLARTDVGVTEFTLGQPSLDEVFFALTGRPTPRRTGEAE
ncbi:ATP-binding cassette domain-containing protein [Cryptosporangium minutisporangium]|uniref:Daunorubicin resistance protein DrrA family ABC transporter ATP-binding protein n=1 Tax=Cryptosporangium minutisporangium TaxID=113569 RepID=A0ABP6TBD5_9ACTN